jgi:hypothetical protein
MNKLDYFAAVPEKSFKTLPLPRTITSNKQRAFALEGFFRLIFARKGRTLPTNIELPL